MAASTVEIAVTAKLKATGAITALVSTRVFPQLDTQEPALPSIVYSVLGSEGGKRLSGAANALRKWVIRIDCYADTEIAADALAKAVRDALTPDGSPWTDSANGVQGCFFVDSAEDFTEDGVRVRQETFEVWHTPT